ncbi:MAG: hypothetical protein WDN28_25545 [Chthoniobacter sp.]
MNTSRKSRATGKTLDITLWSQFTDSKDVKSETLAPSRCAF